MTRFLLSFFLVLLMMVLGSLYLLFSSSGNDILRPYLNSYLQNNVQGVKIEVEKFRLKPSFIGFNARVNDTISLRALGDMSLLSQTFDVNYTLYAESIETKEVQINAPMAIKGTAKGTVEHLTITGFGEAFASKVQYALALIENVPSHIRVHIAKAHIASILALAKQKPYLDGYVTIDANMPKLDAENLMGEATLKVEEGVFNRELIEKEFQVTLPPKSALVANIKAKAVQKEITFHGEVESNLATLHIKDGRYNVEEERLKSHYTLHIDSMQPLKAIAKQPLEGELTLDGTMGYENRNLRFTGATKSFGGESFVSSNGEKAELYLKEVETEKLLKKLGQSSLLETLKTSHVTPHTTNATLKLTSLTPLTGDFKATLPASMKASEQDLKMTTKVEGNIKQNHLYAHAGIESKIANITAHAIDYNLATSTLKTKVNVDIANLAHFASIAQRPLEGEFKAIADVKMIGEKLDIEATTQSFGGQSKVVVKGDTLKATLNDIIMAKLFTKLGEKELLETLASSKVLPGKSSATLNLSSLKALKGNFKVNNSALLDKMPMKNSLMGTLANQQVEAKLTVNSPAIKANVKDIRYALPTEKLHATYDVDLPDLSKLKSFTGKVYRGDMQINGTIQKERVLKVTGYGKELGGSIDFTLVDTLFKAHTKGTTVSKMMYLLDYPQVLEAVSEVDLTYDLATKSGTCKADLDKVQLLPTQLTTLVKQFSGNDLTKAFLNQSNFYATIGESLINFSFNAMSKRHGIVIKEGKLNRLTDKLNIPMDLTIDKKEIQARIVGTIEKPRVTLDTSRYLEKRAKDKVKKELDKVMNQEKIDKTLDKYLDKNQQEQFKNLFKGVL
jgi:hypothetical protein